MPRGKKPTITYGKAQKSPSQRTRAEINQKNAAKVPMKKPQGLSEIAEYVEENKEYRDSIRELVQEFQTEECDHTRPRVEVASTPSKRFMKCPQCGDIKAEQRKGL